MTNDELYEAQIRERLSRAVAGDPYPFAHVRYLLNQVQYLREELRRLQPIPQSYEEYLKMVKQ